METTFAQAVKIALQIQKMVTSHELPTDASKPRITVPPPVLQSIMLDARTNDPHVTQCGFSGDRIEICGVMFEAVR